MTKFTAYIYLLLHKKCKGEPRLEFEHYGGSTTCWKERNRHHKEKCTDPNSKNYNLKVYQYIREHGGYDNWEMVLVQTVEVESKQELRKIEAYWIIFTGATLNSLLPGRSRKEYYEQNKEKIKEKDKEYYERNKEKIKKREKEYYEQNKEKKKEYYEINKEKISEKMKKKFTCECGLTLNWNVRLRHYQSQKHQNYLKSK